MKSFFQALGQAMGYILNIRLNDMLDILIVAALIYFAINIIRRTRTYRVFQGILILLIALWLSDICKLHTLNYILRNTMQLGFLALVILFQPELRRLLERLGTGRAMSAIFGKSADNRSTESAITQIVMACADLSASRTGALIIFERENSLDDQIRTGTVIDADTTAELLKNIFYDKAPLHDGAVIIRNGRIQAAGCMLPLSNNNNLSKDLGMRHRAGIGMSEASDALVAIVSEESGAISVASDGMLKRHLSTDTFEKLLRSGLMKDDDEAGNKNFISRIITERINK